MSGRDATTGLDDGELQELALAEPSTAARLYSGCELIAGELHAVGPGLESVFTARSPESDGVNEDSAAIIPFDERSGLLVVVTGSRVDGRSGGPATTETRKPCSRTRSS